MDPMPETLPSETVIVAAHGDTVRTIAPADLAATLAEARTNVWIDLRNTGQAGFDVIRPLAFHPMAVEDCVLDINHPKVDDYRDYLYIALHSARWEATDALPVLKELDVLIGKNYVVTYHEEEMRSVTKAREILSRRADVLSRGPDHVLYVILDVMVDNYIPIIDMIQDRIDQLAERVLHNPNRRVVAEILRLKRGVAALRRIVGPQRDTILALTRSEYSGISAEMRPYLRDIFDRMVRVSESVESFRDELTTMLDIYVSQVSNQLNEVMKVLTVITVIIVPVTLVASVFGMNVLFPGTNTRTGFYWSLGIMLAVGFGMWWYFRSRRWL
ncbi:MAG: magnesium/cobalt transporter CorA [Candidatus Eiseniibacteriota bacterium]